MGQGDRELYLSLQDENYPAWKEVQEDIVDLGPFPSSAREGVPAMGIAIVDSRIVGDRASIEIRYTAALPSGERASFRAVRFYRYASDGRWLHTKADPTYGGETVSLTREHVEVTVLSEDADWMQPLVSALEDTVYRFCELSPCRQPSPLKLDLAATLDEDTAPDDGTLPAPFLVGVPENETALNVWSNGLQTFALDILIAREIGSLSDDAEEGEILRNRLRAWFLGKLGLGEALSPDVEVVRDAIEEGTWIPLESAWALPPDDVRRPLAEAETDLLLAFVEQTYGSSAVAALPQALRDHESAEAALAEVAGVPWRAVKRHTLAHTREMTAEQSDALAAFDTYDLLLTCRETLDSMDARVTWGLRLDEERLTLLSTGHEFCAGAPVAWSPDGGRLLMVRNTEEDGGLYLLRAGYPAPQHLGLASENEQDANRFSVAEIGWSPDGRHMVYGTAGASGAYGIADLETGEEILLDGIFVAWSPTYSRLIYGVPVPWHWAPELRISTYWLWDQEDDRARRLAPGYAVAWSPDGMYIAYVSPEPALRVFNVITGGSETLLDKRSLQQALDFRPSLSPTSGRPFELAWSPTNKWIAIGATRVSDDGAEEGLTMVVSPESYRVLGRQAGGIHNVVWSPDGRRVTSITLDKGRFNAVVTDLDGEVLLLEQGKRMLWSPDGRYLASIGIQESDKQLQILDPDGTERRAFDLQGTGWCSSLMWNPQVPLCEPAKD
jgi:WD40 repeat protein